MPLSRLTQTLPVDLAAAASESDAAPVGAAFVEAFVAGAGALPAAGALAAVPAEGLIGDLLEAGVAGAAPAAGAMPESLPVVLLFLLFFVVVPVSAFVLAGCSLAVLVSVAFFLWLFLVAPDSFVLADWSSAVGVPALFLLFLEPVSLAAAELSAAIPESADVFFLDFDFLPVVVSDAAEVSLAAAASFLDFLDFFFVVESVVWSPVLVWALASAGAIDSASRRLNPAIHVVILRESLIIVSSFVRGGWNSPGCLELREARVPRLAFGKKTQVWPTSTRPRAAIMPVPDNKVNPGSPKRTPGRIARATLQS